jgi:putative FmdB family regulatory protein
MPIYEYMCEKCGKTIEAIQKVNDPAPECHGKMKKLISKSSFILKGKGWYVTDYKDKKKPKPSAGEKA